MNSKNILNERISDIVYHFTTLRGLVSILATNTMCGSPSVINKTDYKVGLKSMKNGILKYPYYLCFSRTPSSSIGYPMVRTSNIANGVENNDMWEFLVRITFDGVLLNSNHKGKPVSFFGNPNELGPMWKSILKAPQYQLKLSQGSDDFVKDNRVFVTLSPSKMNQKEWGFMYNGKFYPINPTEKEIASAKQTENGFGFWKDMYPWFNQPTNFASKEDEYEYLAVRKSEYEDRLFMRQLRLSDVIRYIKNVDILVRYNTLSNINDRKLQDIGTMIRFAINTLGDDKVHVVSSDKEFNSFNYRNDQINKKKFIDIAGSDYHTERFTETEEPLSLADFSALSKFAAACVLSFTPKRTEEFVSWFANALYKNYKSIDFSSLTPTKATNSVFVRALKTSSNVMEYVHDSIIGLKNQWLSEGLKYDYNTSVEKVFIFFRSTDNKRDVLTLLNDFFVLCTKEIGIGYGGIKTMYEQYCKYGDFDFKKPKSQFLKESIIKFHQTYNRIWK